MKERRRLTVSFLCFYKALMKKIVYWLRNARIVALPQSILPSAVAFCLATNCDGFSVWLGIVAIFGVMAAHLAVNLFDDYFDYVNSGGKSREQMAGEGNMVRVAKSPYLYSGEVTPKKLFGVASIFSAIALAFGLVVFAQRGFIPLLIAVAAGFLGFFYSAKPIQFCYRGLGELVTGVIFGPMLMSGVYYSAAGTFSAEIWPVSAVVGVLVTNILFTHSVMDSSPDTMVGKKTLAGMLKSNRMNLTASAIFNFLPYIIIVVASACGTLPWKYLITLIALPRSIYLFYLLYEFSYHPERQFGKKWWLGPMENWDSVEENNMQWFALRWYLSRNILQLFCIMLVVCALL